MKYTFGKKLQMLRKQKTKLSQHGLAKATGVPFYTIVALENDRSIIPMLTTALKLMKFFKIPLEKFVEDVKFKK